MEAVAAQPILEVEHLSVQLRSRTGLVTLVDDVSYRVDPAEALALVGESGAGKSVSIRSVVGLLNRRRFVTSGRIVLDGVDLSSMTPAARRAHITRTASLVFQDPTRSLNPTMRVGWQIAEALYRRRPRQSALSKDQAKRRAVALMRDVGIADPDERFHSFPHELSGGMRQRIVIAIALSCEPKIVFCDEPTTSLDVTTQAQIMDLLDELRASRGISVVLVTHDLALASSRVDEVMVMYAGRIVERLAASDVARRARMPYSRALLGSVPRVSVHGDIPHAIPGAPPDPRSLPAGCPFHPRCDRVVERCLTETPPLVDIGEGQLCACWNPVPVTEGTTVRQGSTW